MYNIQIQVYGWASFVMLFEPREQLLLVLKHTHTHLYNDIDYTNGLLFCSDDWLVCKDSTIQKWWKNALTVEISLYLA